MHYLNVNGENMNLIKSSLLLLTVSSVFIVQTANAAIALDRTRIIYNENNKSVSLGLTNEHKEKPYLAQAWLENDKDEKINSPFIVTPPVQRIEADSKSQLKIQVVPAISTLPQDRESVYYLNVREIPPRSDKPNVLQIALQTKIKLFYRPKSISVEERLEENPLGTKVTIVKQGSDYIVNNPSPYYLTITKLLKNNNEIENFEPIMVPPLGQQNLDKSIGDLGAAPAINYLNDFGGVIELKFNCQSSQCSVTSSTKKG